jgi:hypothetical protein
LFDFDLVVAAVRVGANSQQRWLRDSDGLSVEPSSKKNKRVGMHGRNVIV